MSGDIVERLRRWDDGRISTHYEGCWNSHPVCAILLAADAIEARDDTIATLTATLTAERAEVERLRAAGDALAEILMDGHPLIAAWREARRGG